MMAITIMFASLVKMFVDLIGTGTPTSSDRDEVCEVLRVALRRADTTIPTSVAVSCLLEETPTVKRSTSYVAQLSYRTLIVPRK